MSYDLNGLGFSEIAFINMYMPNTAKRVDYYISIENYKKAVQLAREAIAVKYFSNGGK